MRLAAAASGRRPVVCQPASTPSRSRASSAGAAPCAACSGSHTMTCDLAATTWAYSSASRWSSCGCEMSSRAASGLDRQVQLQVGGGLLPLARQPIPASVRFRRLGVSQRERGSKSWTAASAAASAMGGAQFGLALVGPGGEGHQLFDGHGGRVRHPCRPGAGSAAPGAGQCSARTGRRRRGTSPAVIPSGSRSPSISSRPASSMSATTPAP